MEQQQNIPDFMKKYYQGSDYEGQAGLENLAKQYADERAVFLQTTFVQKQQFQRDWNKLTGQRKELTPEEALKPMQDQYQNKAEKIATSHGYKEQPQQKTGQASQKGEQPEPTTREAFLQKIKSQQEQRQPSQQQKDQQLKTPPAQPQTDRDRFIAKLATMKQEQQNITHKPKL